MSKKIFTLSDSQVSYLDSVAKDRGVDLDRLICSAIQFYISFGDDAEFLLKNTELIKDVINNING